VSNQKNEEKKLLESNENPEMAIKSEVLFDGMSPVKVNERKVVIELETLEDSS